jgi:hypothetical protein
MACGRSQLLRAKEGQELSPNRRVTRPSLGLAGCRVGCTSIARDAGPGLSFTTTFVFEVTFSAFWDQHLGTIIIFAVSHSIAVTSVDPRASGSAFRD